MLSAPSTSAIRATTSLEHFIGFLYGPSSAPRHRPRCPRSYCVISGIDILDASPSSPRALCARGFFCVYLDTGNPTTTSTTATPRTATMTKAAPPNALGSLDIGNKGYHLA